MTSSGHTRSPRTGRPPQLTAPARLAGGPVVAAIFATALLIEVPSAHAEPVLDRALSGAQVLTAGGCAQLKISFNFRVRYASHFPVSQGRELRIMVRALDPALARSEMLTRRESLRAPASKAAHVKSIEFDVDPAGGPALIINFDAPVHYAVGQGGDFESVVVAVSGAKPSSRCKPDFPAAAPGGWSTSVAPDAPSSGPTEARLPPRNKDRPTGTLSEADKRSAAAAMDEGRAALKKNDLAAAIRSFSKVLALPEGEFSAQAQEFLGVARQRQGDLAEAEAEFRDYLARYPTGEGADRVRQRLAGVETAQGQAQGKLRSAEARPKRSSKFHGNEDGSPAVSLSGSASQFYIRDDSFRTLRDPSLPPEFTNDPDDHRVHQNELLSSLDAIATWSDDATWWRLRFSGTEEHDFSGEAGEVASVAALFVEGAVKDWGVEGRLGRQTRNTGGVLGRFDGGLLRWQADSWVALNVVAGSPVARRSDEPFKDEKLFYGVSADFGELWSGLDFSLFAIEQRIRGTIDRQAIGAEARYLTDQFAGFGTVDYDVHFGELNAAILSGTWTFEDKGTLHGGAEYRKSPYLSAWTALQGQPFITLYDMLKVRTAAEIDQLAIDRTATYRSATIGYARPLNEHLQASVDVTVSDTSGTISSAGVLGAPPTGTEYYYSAQLVANDMVETGDMYIFGLRFADREDSNLYVLDLNARYPLSEAWRVGPRLRLGYQVGDRTDLTEYTVLPSVLINYAWSKSLGLELEVGANWTDTRVGNVRETNTEFFFTVGYRLDFYADGQTR